MCLYPTLIDNPKYLSNKKNGGIIPHCFDERIKKVPIGCGYCEECRKKKAGEWYIRLENARVLRAGYKLDNTFKEIQNYIADKSAESTIESTAAMARKLTEEGRQLWLSNDITEAQKDELKQMAKAQLNELLARTFGEIAGGLATIEGIQQRYQELRIMGESNQIAREKIANELLMNRNTNYTNISMNAQSTEASKSNTERTAKATERGQNIKAATDLVDTAVEYVEGRDSRSKNKTVKKFGR